MKLIPMEGDPKDRQSWNRGGRTHQLKKMIDEIVRFADENNEYFLEITEWEEECHHIKLSSFVTGLRETIKWSNYDKLSWQRSGIK